MQSVPSSNDTAVIGGSPTTNTAAPVESAAVLFSYNPTLSRRVSIFAESIRIAAEEMRRIGSVPTGDGLRLLSDIAARPDGLGIVTPSVVADVTARRVAFIAARQRKRDARRALSSALWDAHNPSPVVPSRKSPPHYARPTGFDARPFSFVDTRRRYEVATIGDTLALLLSQHSITEGQYYASVRRLQRGKALPADVADRVRRFLSSQKARQGKNSLIAIRDRLTPAPRYPVVVGDVPYSVILRRAPFRRLTGFYSLCAVCHADSVTANGARWRAFALDASVKHQTAALLSYRFSPFRDDADDAMRRCALAEGERAAVAVASACRRS